MEGRKYTGIMLREMPHHEKPRERLARAGAESLTDAELIAILLRTGTKKRDVLEVTRSVLHYFGDLVRVSQASLDEMQQVSGVGRVKAVELVAAMELGKRLVHYSQREKHKISKAEDVFELLKTEFLDCEVEHFKVLLLNTKHRVLKVVSVSQGTVDGTLATPRDVFRQAVRENARAVIVTHNHPSGDPEPSQSDIQVTKKLKQAADILEISLLDHIIFGHQRFVSFAERGLL